MDSYKRKSIKATLSKNNKRQKADNEGTINLEELSEPESLLDDENGDNDLIEKINFVANQSKSALFNDLNQSFEVLSEAESLEGLGDMSFNHIDINQLFQKEETKEYSTLCNLHQKDGQYRCLKCFSNLCMDCNLVDHPCYNDKFKIEQNDHEIENNQWKELTRVTENLKADYEDISKKLKSFTKQLNRINTLQKNIMDSGSVENFIQNQEKFLIALKEFNLEAPKPVSLSYEIDYKFFIKIDFFTDIS